MKIKQQILSVTNLKCRRLKGLVAVLVIGLAANHALAEDWGIYSIVPVSAPRTVLELSLIHI